MPGGVAPPKGLPIDAAGLIADSAALFDFGKFIAAITHEIAEDFLCVLAQQRRTFYLRR